MKNRRSTAQVAAHHHLCGISSPQNVTSLLVIRLILELAVHVAASAALLRDCTNIWDVWDTMDTRDCTNIYDLSLRWKPFEGPAATLQQLAAFAVRSLKYLATYKCWQNSTKAAICHRGCKARRVEARARILSLHSKSLQPPASPLCCQH